MSLLAEVFSFALSKTSATVAIRASRMVSSMSVLITFTLSDKGTAGGSSPMSANAAPPRCSLAQRQKEFGSGSCVITPHAQTHHTHQIHLRGITRCRFIFC